MGQKVRKPNVSQASRHDRSNSRPSNIRSRNKSDNKVHTEKKSTQQDDNDEVKPGECTRIGNCEPVYEPAVASSWVLLICAVCCGLLNMLHTSTLFENDRHFSHLSQLEREMTFRTEMGFYYSHYKTIVEAEDFLSGIKFLMHNNATEYPTFLNSLQRFNIMPEVVIGALYRCMMTVSKWAEMDLQVCWKVLRGAGLTPVSSCEGVGDPANFYVCCTWGLAGLTGALVFLSGALLSRSVLGGLLSALCFFFNHGEATRVMWTPPLRETFGFPFSLLVNIIVTVILRKAKGGFLQPLLLAAACYCYLVSWQFAQYTLVITIVVVYSLHAVQLIQPKRFVVVLIGLILAFGNCLVTMFGNRMLLTSPLAGGLLAMGCMFLSLESVFNWLPVPLNKAVQLAFIVLSPIACKLELANWFGTDEDSHLFNILKSKFTNYSDFHTSLYTCSDEFDFLPFETYRNLSSTLLLPVAIIVIVVVANNILVTMCDNSSEKSTTNSSDASALWHGVDPGVVYNIIMLVAYCILAALIMRLKLFMTPQLCIVASLITSRKYFGSVHRKEMHYYLLAAVVAGMFAAGSRNILQQRAIQGEYRNPNLEELVEWVNTETATSAVFAGTMPTMASVMLSTRRPVVNHPHYETKQIRTRTKLVYSVFSRRSPEVVYQTLLGLQVNYLVLDENWCFHRSKPGCGIVDLWDIEEPHNRKQRSLCPALYNRSPAPFHRVFANDGYVVLQVPSKFVQIPPPKVLLS